MEKISKLSLLSLIVVFLLVFTVGCELTDKLTGATENLTEAVDNKLTTDTPGDVELATYESGAAADGQNTEVCGENYPQFDIATQDPFVEERGTEPAADFTPPFEKCEEEYDALMATRTACDEVASQTLLVAKEGADDPRWTAGDFDAHYPKIQDAIDAAEHCDMIIVRPGIYKEYLSLDGKDLKIYSDVWNEAGTEQDGDERMTDYVAEKIDLLHYYETGERNVEETRTPYLQPLKRAARTILEGGGYEEGPDLGGTITRNHDDPEDPNRGCGNRRPMVDFKAGTTRNTIFDGFSVRLMPEQDHTIPGHGHTLQCRGGSPIIRHNIIYNNGSTGVGAHTSWLNTSPVTPPCAEDATLEQETFSNPDYRGDNTEFRPTPIVYDNISYQNNGLGMGNNHYGCGVMYGNESFWNAVPEDTAGHQSPGIGTRHGAKPYIAYNIVYENAWVGIGVRQGYLQPKAECAEDPEGCNHIDERTQAVVLGNIVYANGHSDTPEENRGAIAIDGAGLPDDPVLVKDNIVFESQVSGIGTRNEYAGVDRGYVMDDTYVDVIDNITFSNARQGITCKGSDYGTSHCNIVGNTSYWNHIGGIGFAENSEGTALHNTVACNNSSGIVTKKGGDVSIYNNISYYNVNSGILDIGTDHDYNLLSGNNGKDATCGTDKQAQSCTTPQYGKNEGGTDPGENDLFVDPLFTDVLDNDYTLTSSSPALDAATDVSSYYTGWESDNIGSDK